MGLRRTAMEVRELAGGVLLREGTRCAFFQPSQMRLFGLEAPLILSTDELADQASRQIGPAPVAAHNPRKLDDREALFPVLHDAPKSTRKPHLGRLTLNISNACNLACTYCYANGGNYGAQPALMSPETVRKVLDRIMDLYGEIRTLHFFGGEPLMNSKAIDVAAEYLHLAVSAGRTPRMPALAATTNGTWSQPEVLDTLQRWQVALTVSWDGPAEVHNSCRPLTTGEPSSAMLETSLERFDERHIPYDIECTYNGRHLRNGVSVANLMDFFYARTGKRIVHIAPAYPAEPGDFEYGRAPDFVDPAILAAQYRRATQISVENLASGEGPVLEFAHRVALRLSERIPCEIECPAFFTQLSVTTDGSVYPCFMFMSEPAFRMGNLVDGSFPGSDSARVVQRYFTELNQHADNPWYACLSGGCVAGESRVSGSLGGRAMAPVAAAIAEECVLFLAAHARKG
jgi:uncharacterized protein